MNSPTIYHYLSYINLEDFNDMLVDLRDLHAKVSDSRACSDADRCDALGEVESAIDMAIRSLLFAASSDTSRACSLVYEEYRRDYCLQLRKAISNSVFINPRHIDSAKVEA